MLLNPFELCPGYDPPARPVGGLKLATVVFDLIPFLFQEHYLSDPPNAAWNYRRLQTLRHYDLLMTISESTRDDCLRMLGLNSHRTINIGTGAEEGRFFPDRNQPISKRVKNLLWEIGIRRAFLFCLAGIDDRKNVRGLLEAYAQLEPELKRRYQLVVTCFLPDEFRLRYRLMAEELGIADDVIFTGEIPDETLRILYQRCEAFVFPSLYEGFGLPIVEAMQCGVPVIAGNNSSQVEVLGDAGLLVNASDPGEISARLKRVLNDPDLIHDLGRRGIERAQRFRWEAVAERALEGLDRVVHQSETIHWRTDRSMTPRPRIAIVSPWRPKGSGIADYAMRLVNVLKDHYTIDLYHDAGYVPEPVLGGPEFASFDYRLFARNRTLIPYRGVLYQMGNSFYHGFLYDMLMKWPGIVTLHDFNLAAFHFWKAHQGGVPIDNFRWEIEYCYPDRISEIVPNLWEWAGEPGGLQEACSRRNLFLNRRLFALSEAVVVHSPWCLDQVQVEMSEFQEKTVVIPHGADPIIPEPGLRNTVRTKFGLPQDAIIFGCFGILSQGKMNAEAMEAYRLICDEFPKSQFIFVGKDWENGAAKAKVESLNLQDRVRLLGPLPDEEFTDLIAATDVGICLRRPPTYGETSGALLHLLRYGTPSIITNVATFSGYPDSIVRKVNWPDDGISGLAQAMRELALDARRREEMGLAAREFVRLEHPWSKMALLYAEVIERQHAARTRCGTGPHLRPGQFVDSGVKSSIKSQEFE